MPVVLNAANEVAVELFLNEKIGFNDISRIIEYSMSEHKSNNCPDINDILITDNSARKKAYEWFEKNYKE